MLIGWACVSSATCYQAPACLQQLKVRPLRHRGLGHSTWAHSYPLIWWHSLTGSLHAFLPRLTLLQQCSIPQRLVLQGRVLHLGVAKVALRRAQLLWGTWYVQARHRLWWRIAGVVWKTSLRFLSPSHHLFDHFILPLWQPFMWRAACGSIQLSTVVAVLAWLYPWTLSSFLRLTPPPSRLELRKQTLLFLFRYFIRSRFLICFALVHSAGLGASHVAKKQSPRGWGPFLAKAWQTQPGLRHQSWHALAQATSDKQMVGVRRQVVFHPHRFSSGDVALVSFNEAQVRRGYPFEA